MSKQTESPNQFSTEETSKLNVAAKKLYSEQVQAEFAELHSDIELLLQQLQSLSRQSLTTVGSIQ